ncbi:hypothetical protein [Luedemannella helvata]|uniref:hypothetical protein n=1 Tax=Luedemannella helvata TaxID=349315 RepID=UPI0031D537BC
MGGLDEFLDAVRELLANVGVDVSLGTVRALFWLVIGALALYLTYQVVSQVFKGVRAAGLFAKRQIDQKFWRDAGKLATVLSFLLLVVAYAFYGDEQERTLGQAVADLGREQLDAARNAPVGGLPAGGRRRRPARRPGKGRPRGPVPSGGGPAAAALVVTRPCCPMTERLAPFSIRGLALKRPADR